ncbi:ParB/RepB/Spo0J family partition protein [Granulosicoccaceae sp. 1_MG-2023]|nr:ParB/RepB/Spo0J family partition protein [Granulosicoccaceae sp. 1_MG-2023]
MSKKRGLGRGLDALLGGAEQALTTEDVIPADQLPADTAVAAPSSKNGLKMIAIELIKRGTYQPRRKFETQALEELADSIRKQGLVQPVVLRPRTDGYELIAGERRWRAAQLAGLQDIPAVVNDYDDKAAAAVSLIENIQREDLNPLEEANALQRLQNEFAMTHQEVAEAVGRSRAAVSNLLRLLELDEAVKMMVDSGELDMGHARALLSVDKSAQAALAKQVVDKGLSVRATEAMVKKLREPAANSAADKKSQEKTVDPDIQALIDRLSETLGSPVEIQHTANGTGQLQIKYRSLDELDGILNHIH